MQTEPYSVEQYVKDLQAIVAEETDTDKITDRIKPHAKRLAADRSWFKDEYRNTDPEQGFGVHLLHEQGDHELAVFIFAWEPKKGVGAHNHKTWAVVAPIEGEEHESNYERLDDGSKPGYAELKKTHEETLYPGGVVVCDPDDIHSVYNSGDKVSVSLHTYGKHLNYTGRSLFDVEANTETPLIVTVEE